MMPEELPACVCQAATGYTKWNPGGGSFGGSISQQGFSCPVCQRRAMLLYAGYCCCLIIPPYNPKVEDQFEEYQGWLNYNLLVTMRAYGSLVDKLKAIGPDFKPANPHPQLSKLPAELEFAWHNPLFESEWEWVHHRNTAYVECPPDPIKVDHDRFFNDVFRLLDYKFNNIFQTRTEIKNEYCGARNEPWYQVDLFSASGEYPGSIHRKLIVGPRKRVYAIKVKSDSKETFDVSKIRDIAKADQVTYMADGDWQGQNANATGIEIHAWGKEKLIEYLTLVLEALNVTKTT